jgi:hypothetical protein
VAARGSVYRPLLAALLAAASACRDNDCRDTVCTIDPIDGGTTARRDGGSGDAAAGAGDGGRLDSGPFDAGPPRDGGGFSVTPGQAGRTLLRGPAVLTMTGADFFPGEVYLEGDRIRCTGGPGACEGMAQGATLIDTGGVILPGLVDAHNHPAYNWLPEWDSGRLWDDSGQWRASAAYDAFTEPYSNNSGDRVSFCAMVQWGELRSLVSGTTSLAGTGQTRTCYRWLVRNVELGTGYSGFESDKIRSNTLGIDLVDQAAADALIAGMNADQIDAYLVHLAEGRNQRARDEYLRLVQLGLLRPETVIIHGTALTADDFTAVGQAGAKLVWSPSSNMVLYGGTTDVGAAMSAGVSVSLAPDWTPSGEDDVLGELRFARAYLEANEPALASPELLVRMVTSEPAYQIGQAGQLGVLAPGARADLLVLAIDPGDPYAGVVEARHSDVRLVLLGGAPSYGERELMAVLPDAPPSCHELDACGVPKRACWVDTPDGPVSPDSIQAVISGFYPGGPLPLFDCAR